MEKDNKDNLTKIKYYNETEIAYNDLEQNNENDDDESSVNTEELESIRFFDKIIMKKHSFSKAHIPELEIKQIKMINDEIDNKENIKINNNKYKYNNILKKNYKLNKGIRNGLKKIENKSTKAFGYNKMIEDKKKINGKQFRKIK